MNFQGMILPRSSVIKSRLSSPPRLQRRRMMSCTPTIDDWAEVTADEVQKLIGLALKSC